MLKILKDTAINMTKVSAFELDGRTISFLIEGQRSPYVVVYEDDVEAEFVFNNIMSHTKPKDMTRARERVLDTPQMRAEKEKMFDDFWSAYNKSVDKSKSRTKFLSLSIVSMHKILDAVPVYVNRTPEKKYRKNPMTWLNGSCWNDEDVPDKKTKETKDQNSITNRDSLFI